MVEIHSDAIVKNERVLIHDDVLATGGTARAVCELGERLGGKVVQCVFLLQLDTLNGAERLNGYRVDSLLHYWGLIYYRNYYSFRYKKISWR
jgi:adenine phosphoribosyltransferase